MIALTVVLMLHAGCRAIQKSPGQRSGTPEQQAAERSLKLAFLTVAVAQEGYYRSHGAYSFSLVDLGFTEESPSRAITIVAATNEGWIGTGEKNGASCLFFFGIPPADYQRLIEDYEADEGVVTCK